MVSRNTKIVVVSVSVIIVLIAALVLFNGQNSSPILIHIKDVKDVNCETPDVFDNIGDTWLIESSEVINIELKKEMWKCEKSEYYENNKWCDCEVK